MTRYERFSILNANNQPVTTNLSEDEARDLLPLSERGSRVVCDGYRPAYAPDFRTEFSSVQTILPTSLGPVELSATSASHIMASSNASSGYDGGDLLYDGYRWYAGIHLYAASGWDEDPRDTNISDVRHQFTVAGSFGRGNCTPRRRAAIIKAVREAVIEFLDEHPEFLASAEVNNAVRAEESAEKAWSEAQMAEATAKSKFRAAFDRRKATVAALAAIKAATGS